VLQIEAQAPDACEITPNQPTPLPQEKITQIFHTYVSGGVAHVAGEGASNTLQIGEMKDSQVQQAAAHSSQNMTFATDSKERPDLERLVAEMSAHLQELGLSESAARKASTQLQTIRVQLADDQPDAGIITQAGRTLRNVTEGAIGSLLAAAGTQPVFWHWAAQAISSLFPG
jgi:hypothetical protein